MSASRRRPKEKTERLQLRLSLAERRLLERAAKHRALSISAYLRSVFVQQAREELAR